ncbi:MULTISPECIES: helix-turn-helix domain-containing protein [Citromicrobium]|uniref:helix-turn-helix domain-containing protein n=1 Tax=Citromicrobium TaxID=72173 RepID=UPI0001DD1095|nr:MULTISPECIES: helix-turn-helix transcriptional regulator [Citromicrobium]ALG60978.1 DNA-binding protein [Citromicrobium sp. JL477]KPM12163.1 DNA-binding protein [Citromicrobium sp. JL31]KPM15139.1 DNA-binding protein [Citromicrobium sp. JL1351]KPM26441.1 DNA-binding protein [Citromicrobium sp. JL2201]
MDTLKRDPEYIAEQVKLIRKMFSLTQENLADAAGLSSRTIEKIESGRHRPEIQTLRSIARAVQFDVNVFAKPSPEEEERQKSEMLRAFRKTVVAPINPVRTVNDFLHALEARDAFRIDTSAVSEDAALSIAAEMTDWIRDLGDIWDECYMSQRVEYAREFVNLCQQIEGAGYICYMGRHRQQMRYREGSRTILTVGLMIILPKNSDATRYTIIPLEGVWESVEEERANLE